MTERVRWKKRRNAEERFRPLPFAFRRASADTFIFMIGAFDTVAAEGPAFGSGGGVADGTGGLVAEDEGRPPVALLEAILLSESQGEAEEGMCEPVRPSGARLCLLQSFSFIDKLENLNICASWSRDCPNQCGALVHRINENIESFAWSCCPLRFDDFDT